jgi:hypothetical protein
MLTAKREQEMANEGLINLVAWCKRERESQLVDEAKAALVRFVQRHWSNAPLRRIIKLLGPFSVLR